MDVSVSVVDGTAMMHVAGELDAHNCDELGAALRARVGDDHLDRIVVDASELRFVDSSGISALLALRSRVPDAGSGVELRDPTPAVRRVIEMTGLDETFGLS